MIKCASMYYIATAGLRLWRYTMQHRPAEHATQHTCSLTLRLVRPDDERFLLGVYTSTRLEELAPVGWDAAQQGAFLQMQFTA